MESNVRCAAVIPCLNEAGSVGAIVRAVFTQVEAVWVIDDGSSDATSTEAKRAGANVIRHIQNLGKGAALRDGLAAAKQAGHEFAIILDGDGQHDPVEIPKLITAAKNGADLVIGNRMQSCESMDRVRRFVNRWMSSRIEWRWGFQCPDSQCGFRCVRLDAWAELNFRKNRFEVESEMIANFARAGLKIAFVPVACLPAKRPSRIRPLADTARWFWWWWTTR